MLKIRFTRTGKKHQSFFRIVVNDTRRSINSGYYLEKLGYYNPNTKEKSINKERIEYWINKGAQLSDTVHNLLVKEGIIQGKKIPVHKKKKQKKGEKPSSAKNEQQTEVESKKEENQEKKEEKEKPAEEPTPKKS